MHTRIATFDIGTNTVLMLVADFVEGRARVVAERAAITRIGEGLDKSGRISEAAAARTLAALREFADEARKLGAIKLAAVGTQALREAQNGDIFLAPAAEILGSAVEIIAGEREAALALLAVERSFPQLANTSYVVCDIGGGSTEFVFVDQGKVLSLCSIPIGSVRLTERFLHSDPPSEAEIAALRSFVRRALPQAPAGAPTIIGIAGTVTTMAAIAHQISPYDPERIHGMQLSASEIAQTAEQLSKLTLAERNQLIGLDPKRAPVIGAGAWICAEIVASMRATSLLVSDRGIRWGLWYEVAGSAP